MLVIVLRGALDGLGAVAPVGDPDWVGLRGDRALVLDGKTPALPLDSFFALNPAMPNLHRLYKARAAAIVHAAATPYRERSHFDGQDVLESGLAKPGADRHRLAQPRAARRWRPDGRVDPRGSRAFGVGPVTPLVVRGPAPVMSWAPQQMLPASDDTQARLLDLYRHTDPKLATRARRAHAARRARARRRHGRSDADDRGSCRRRGIARVRAYFADAAGTAAAISRGRTARASARWASSAGTRTSTRARRRAGSPTCSARSTVRWPRSRRNMGEAWRETVVAVVTEFGRTARINGTDGTDHGTGTVAFLAGGALKGGRVIADWPGLKPARPVRGPRPRADHRSARRAEGRAQGSPAGRGEGAREQRSSPAALTSSRWPASSADGAACATGSGP